MYTCLCVCNIIINSFSNAFVIRLKGTILVNELIDIYGLDVVQAYMGHIQQNAELAVRDMLKLVGNKVLRDSGSSSVTAVDYLDDGSRIKLRLKFDVEKGEAVCDFT